MDDFSFRRGHKWGIVLVDLQRHKLVVDILPDRSSETFGNWLDQHAGVEVVSRDRSGEYSDTVSKAAPEAIQGATVPRYRCYQDSQLVLPAVLALHSTSFWQRIWPLSLVNGSNVIFQ